MLKTICFSMIWRPLVCKIHPWALRTTYRAEGSGRGRGGVAPEGRGSGYCRQHVTLHASRPEASADFTSHSRLAYSEASDPINPPMVHLG